MSRPGDRSPRPGTTLVEVLIGLSFFVVLFGGAWLIFGTGVRGFYRDAGNTSSMQDAMVVLERIDADLDQLMVSSSLVENPVWISRKGNRIRFYVAREGDQDRDLDAVIRGLPVDYTLTPVPGRSGEFWPTRNGVPIRRLRVKSWTFRLTRSGSGPRGMPWLEMDVEALGLFGRKTFPLVRRVPLAAAATAERYGTAYAYLDRWMELGPEDKGPLWPEDDLPERQVPP